MDTDKAIKVLEALASGYSPVSGELLENESVLNERDVIRALQFAIDRLKDEREDLTGTVEIPENEILKVRVLFDGIKRNPTPSRFTQFFLGRRKFKDGLLVAHGLFGKYNTVYSEGKLLDFFTQYMLQNNWIQKPVEEPYRKIDFFQKEKFNSLTPVAIAQLKSKVSELGVLKKENLSEYIVQARLQYPRAYEAWSEKELDLLRTAIKYTNDLDLLSECFQRGKGSIEATGQRLIFESQPHNAE